MVMLAVAREDALGDEWAHYRDPHTGRMGKIWRHCESTGEAMWID